MLRGISDLSSRAGAHWRGDRVFVNSRALLFYYQNRLEGYGLEAWSGLTPGLDKWHRNVWRGE